MLWDFLQRKIDFLLSVKIDLHQADPRILHFISTGLMLWYTYKMIDSVDFCALKILQIGGLN